MYSTSPRQGRLVHIHPCNNSAARSQTLRYRHHTQLLGCGLPVQMPFLSATLLANPDTVPASGDFNGNCPSCAMMLAYLAGLCFSQYNHIYPFPSGCCPTFLFPLPINPSLFALSQHDVVTTYLCLLLMKLFFGSPGTANSS